MDRRWLAGIVLLTACGGLVAWAWSAAPDGDGVDGSYLIRVRGQDGLVWEGTARSGGDALSLLQDAGRRGGFEVVVEDRGLAFGPDGCAGMYVVAVAGQAESGAGGWVYEVGRNGAWERPAHSAACHRMRAGDEVLWRWSEGGA